MKLHRQLIRLIALNGLTSEQQDQANLLLAYVGRAKLGRTLISQ